MKAIYVFLVVPNKIKSKDSWMRDCEVSVIGEDLNAAINSVVMMLGGEFDSDTLRLAKVIDYELHINQQNIVERKLTIEERHSDSKVKHSGQIKEIRETATK
jgi:uncharacterized protein (DUF1015 family)